LVKKVIIIGLFFLFAVGIIASTITLAATSTWPPSKSSESITISTGKFITPPVQSAALTIVKSADPTSYDDIGQTITYTYTVTNSGTVPISAPINIIDDNFGTITIQKDGPLDPGISIKWTITYKITEADINSGSVSNLAYATGSFNSKSVISPSVIAIVSYEQPTNDRGHNREAENGNYGDAVAPVVPVAPVPMNIVSPMYGSPMYGNVPYGYGSKPYGTTEVPSSNVNGHKAKAHLSKHKHKHKNLAKHHKQKKVAKCKLDKI
jgi:hypothetical protein